jgi:hypothetical protein
MADQAFETRIARVLGTYADEAVVPTDAAKIALAARAERTGSVSRLVRGARSTRPSAELRLVLVAAALLAALVIGSLLVAGSRRTQPALVDAAPAPTPSAGPLASGSLPVALAGPWMAARPEDLTLGTASDAARMSLFVDGSGSVVFVTTADDPAELLTSLPRMEAPDVVRFSSPSATGSVESGGTTLRGCATGEAGTYRVSRSSDGLRLTLDLVEDACPSRALVYARTWTRSLGLPNSGGIGVVDAFDPLFTVELPPGGYTTDRVADHLTIVQVVPEFQFLAWKDPQGWNDPCDLAKGRYPIEPGADAVVAYFRQLEGFTVDSTSELEVDGHRAVRVRLHANPDVACPQPFMYQAKAQTDNRTWFLRPGDTDSYIVVELADDTTLMFEVLPAPSALEDQVIGSIRFLDQLSGAP